MLPANISAIFILLNRLSPSTLLSFAFGILDPKLIEESGPIVLPRRISGKLISSIIMVSIISQLMLHLFMWYQITLLSRFIIEAKHQLSTSNVLIAKAT